MGRRIRVVLGLVLAVPLLASVVAVQPAYACSCAEPTVADLVRRNPGVAIAVVRRIDRDGGTTGVGAVERTLRGRLPPQVPLHLDDGASCRPYLDVGQLAALSFEPDGGSWQTLECGMLEAGPTFADAYGPLRPDPGARGDPALALATSLPGAQIVLLDDALRVLATADVSEVDAVQACGDALLVTTSWEERGAALLLSLPDLDPMARRPLRRVERVLDARCDGDGGIAAVTVTERATRRMWLYADLLDGRPRELPAADDAALRNGEVLLLRGDNDGRRGVLSAHTIASGETVQRRVFAGIATYGMEAAPDGEHVTVRGYAEEPVLLTLHADSGAIVGRTGGWWMPPEHDAWAADEQLILIDEQRGMGQLPHGARVVDLRLAELGRVPSLVPSRLVAGGGVVAAVGGAEVTVASVDGVLRASRDPRTAAAFDVAILGQVTPARDGGAGPALPEPELPARRERAVWPLVIAGGIAIALVVALLARRRRTRLG